MASDKKGKSIEQQELDDRNAGRAHHTHDPRDGSPAFRCASPYCDDLGSPDPLPGPGEPMERAARYRRD